MPEPKKFRLPELRIKTPIISLDSPVVVVKERKRKPKPKKKK